MGGGQENSEGRTNKDTAHTRAHTHTTKKEKETETFKFKVME